MARGKKRACCAPRGKSARSLRAAVAVMSKFQRDCVRRRLAADKKRERKVTSVYTRGEKQQQRRRRKQLTFVRPTHYLANSRASRHLSAFRQRRNALGWCLPEMQPSAELSRTKYCLVNKFNNSTTYEITDDVQTLWKIADSLSIV
jgi:hypothetical protein